MSEAITKPLPLEKLRGKLLQWRENAQKKAHDCNRGTLGGLVEGTRCDGRVDAYTYVLEELELTEMELEDYVKPVVSHN